MKSKRVLIPLTMLLAAVLLAGVVWAQGSGPGTEADPVVAKSYVDKYVQLQVVELIAGQSLLADGGTELILRGGQAEAITSPLGGLADLTGGKDLAQGARIPANHLLLVPRDDGRGVFAVTDIILLVRGGYEIR
ncbi:MAG: hypothetical protein ACOX3A_02255 [bacterium]|jgi:hypothetical protein